MGKDSKSVTILRRMRKYELLDKYSPEILDNMVKCTHGKKTRIR